MNNRSNPLLARAIEREPSSNSDRENQSWALSSVLSNGLYKILSSAFRTKYGLHKVIFLV
jgi:hypothetical protein